MMKLNGFATPLYNTKPTKTIESNSLDTLYINEN